MNFKDDVNKEDLAMLHPYTYILLGAFVNYCTIHKLPCTITSLMEEVDGRVSSTHREGRAFDASIRGWPEVHIKKFEFEMNRDYKHIAAISMSDKKPRAVVVHGEGANRHAHIQCRR